MMEHESGICDECQFKTQHLSIKPWHHYPFEETKFGSLAEVVADMITEPVTQYLPPSFAGVDDVGSAQAWIQERDEESTTLLAVDLRSGQPVGLVFLYEIPSEAGTDDEVRIGYLVAEHAWGRGIATEMLKGLVEWGRQQETISSFVAGADRNNNASRRVLGKCDFEIIEQGEYHELYRLELNDPGDSR